MLIYKEAEKMSSPSSEILDVGTKDGRFLSNITGNVTALDIDLEPSVDNVSFLLADGCQMPFRDDYFDIIISNQVYEHISQKQREKMTDEIMRVLQPDGEFLISIPNRYFLLGGSPHWMPVFWSFLPKNIGLKLSRYVVDNQDYENYKNGFFPISSWSMRRFLENRFEKVEYITLELGRKFGNDVWPEWFNSIYPSLYKLTSYPGLRTIFEWCFGYVSYRVQYPKHD